MLRTVNGDLDDLSLEQFRKYQSTISCTDQVAPAFDGVWAGQIVIVNCIAELCYKTVGGSPQRPVVPGSSRIEGDFTYYRPQLTMRVMSFEQSSDEWRASVTWNMALEEI